MTHLKSLPVSVHERIAEAVSAGTVALGTLLGLVALATLVAV